MRDTTYTARTLDDYLCMNNYRRHVMAVETCNISIEDEELEFTYSKVKELAAKSDLTDKELDCFDTDLYIKRLTKFIKQQIINYLLRYGYDISDPFKFPEYTIDLEKVTTLKFPDFVGQTFRSASDKETGNILLLLKEENGDKL